MYKRENAVTWYANYAPTVPVTVTESLTPTARPGVATGNGSIHKLLLYYRPHNMGLRLRQKSLFLAYVLAPLCAISNFNYEQVNPRNFPAAMLLHGRLSFRKPVLPSPSSGLVHRAFPIVRVVVAGNCSAHAPAATPWTKPSDHLGRVWNARGKYSRDCLWHK